MDLVPERCLGYGSYGAVFSLRNNDDDCIKIMFPCTVFQESLEVLIREVFGASLSRNRSLLCLSSWGSSWAVVMKRYTTTVQRTLSFSGTFYEPCIVRDLWCSVPDALYNLHRSGLAHRDLSPTNVCINKKNRTTTLIDQGLVGALGSNDNYIQSINQRPPEIFEKRPVHANSDVFSLGLNMMTTWQNQCIISEEDEPKAQAQLQKYIREDLPFWCLLHGFNSETKTLTADTTAARLAKLLWGMLKLDPDERCSIEDVLKDEFWFIEDTTSERVILDQFWSSIQSHKKEQKKPLLNDVKTLFRHEIRQIDPIFVQWDIFHSEACALPKEDRSVFIQVLQKVVDRFLDDSDNALQVFLCAVLIQEFMFSFKGPSYTTFVENSQDIRLEYDFFVVLCVSFTMQASMRSTELKYRDLWDQGHWMGLFTDAVWNANRVHESMIRLIQCLQGCLPLGPLRVLVQRQAFEGWTFSSVEGLGWIQNSFDCDTVPVKIP